VKLRTTLADVLTDRFLTGEAQDGIAADVEWLNETGDPFDWQSPEAHSLAMVLSGPNRRICIFFNGESTEIKMTIPPAKGMTWNILAGTGSDVPPHSVFVFEESMVS
jgi:pullulanase/glycogen debranching enzyme